MIGLSSNSISYLLFTHLCFACNVHDKNTCLPDVQRDLTPPFVDDGLIEVVGFRDAWHGLVLLAPNGHGTRLAQVEIDNILSLFLT